MPTTRDEQERPAVKKCTESADNSPSMANSYNAHSATGKRGFFCMIRTTVYGIANIILKPTINTAAIMTPTAIIVHFTGAATNQYHDPLGLGAFGRAGRTEEVSNTPEPIITGMSTIKLIIAYRGMDV